MACDIGREDDVARLVDAAETALGSIDVLINNAGIAHKDAFLEMDVAEWDRILRVNLRGMFLVAQAVARRMVARGSGVIVNMASTNALGGEELFAHYNASKGGVLQLTRTMAVELGRHGIRVNCLCPGFIRTPLNDAISDEAFVAAYERDKIPLGRAGTAGGGRRGVRVPGVGRRVVHPRRGARDRRGSDRDHVSRCRVVSGRGGTASRTASSCGSS